MSVPASAAVRQSAPAAVDGIGVLHPGDRIDDLRIERLIGRGAMANLYLAVDDKGVERVIKVPRRALAADPVSTVAFENELRLAPFLTDFTHAYMPRVEDSQRRQYLSMDYIRGQDLWTYLKEHGPVDESTTLELGQLIVDAVAALHQRRIIHLDLKLSNVMLTPEREIRLIDFGLANHLDLPDLIFESFREPKGSPAYIAPEQFIGVRDEPRSDLFSVGVMLFELSTGHLPFLDAASERDVVERINSVPLSPCHYRPELSAAFEQLVSRCLAPNPDNRFESMEALAKALAQCHQTPRPLTVPVVTQSSLNKEISGIPSLIGSYFRDRWRRRANSSYRDVERWAAQRRALRGPQRYRILATVNLNDPNEQLHRAILQQALILARAQPNAFLTVMCALSVEPGLSSGEKETTAFNDAIHNGREQVRMLIDQLDTRGCTININVTVSQRPVDTIQQYVTDYAVDLVVLGCRPKNSLASFVHGRTGYRILTSVSCNAFVVHAPNDAGNGDIPAVSAGVNA